MIGASSVVTSHAVQTITATNNTSDPIVSVIAVVIIGIFIIILVYLLRE